MARPFIIWALQRTGSTSLRSALARLCGDPDVLNEPFLLDRPLGRITRAVDESRYADASSELAAQFSMGVSMKHCYELRSLKLNALLLDAVAPRESYRHILLGRQNECDRICSLFLARKTSAWGKASAEEGIYEAIFKGERNLAPLPVDEMLDHSRHSLERQRWLRRQLAERGIEAFDVEYEDLFAGDQESRGRVLTDLAGFLESPINLEVGFIEKFIFSNSQESNRLFRFVPNIEEVRSAYRDGSWTA